MSLLQAVLCGLIYYLGNSPFPFGDAGYYIVYRPIFAGFLVGLVLGDPVMGTVLGATINLMYIGQISAGGAIPSDMCLAGVLGTALGITGGLSTEAALAVAVPLGLLGTSLFYGRMTLDCIWLHLAEKKVEKGETGKIWIYDLLMPQLMLFCMAAIPCTLACYFGAQYIEGVIEFLGGTILNTLGIIGGMMPALGIALTLKFIYKGETKIFFFLGFLMVAFLGLNMIAIGLFALCITIIYTQVIENKEGTAL